MTAEEPEVRSHLEEELARLENSDAHAALGLETAAAQAEIRAAFLRVTKVFHPNRFARRGRDTLRLANEVFLRLKEAYDELSDGRPDRSRSASSHARTRPRAQTADPVRTEPGESRGGTSTRAAAGKANPAPGRSRRRSLSTNPLPAPPPVSPRRTQPTNPFPAPPPGRPGSEPGPAGGARSMPGPHRPRRQVRTEPMPTLAPAREHRPASPSSQPPGRTRPRPGSQPPGARVQLGSGRTGLGRAPGAAGGGRLDACRALVAAERFSEAIAMLEELAASGTGGDPVATYLHYARGRQHEAHGSRVDAHIEYRRALDIDPHFEEARRAIDAMSKRPTRRDR